MLFYIAVALISAYGVFRAYLDFKQEKEIEDINEHLHRIDDSLYSIKLRTKSDDKK